MNLAPRHLPALLASALLGGATIAQSPVDPPPWWRVNDENTVSLAWNFDDPNPLLTTQPTLAVVPSWYNPAITRFPTPLPPPIQYLPSLNGHTGVLGFTGNGTPTQAALDLKVDNFPHLDWIKVFWFQFDAFEGASGSVSQAIRQDLVKYDRAIVTEKHDPIGNGWERVTIGAQLMPQPDDETIDWTFTENALGSVAIDNLFVNSRCIKPGVDETGDALGDPDGQRIDLGLATLGADCIAAAVTTGPAPSFVRNYWISSRASTAGAVHRIFRLNQVGVQVAPPLALGVTLTQAPLGLSDLTVERIVPTVGPVQQFVYAIADQRPSGGNVVILAIDEATNSPVPARNVVLTNFPPIATVANQAFGLAFDPSGNLGDGTFWVSDQSGVVREYDRSGNPGDTHGIPTGCTGLGYDEALGNFYGFSTTSVPSPFGPLQVNGFEWSAYDRQLTGVRFCGDLTIANPGGPVGGVATGLEVHRRPPDGDLRLVCVVQAQGTSFLYELAGPFRFGRSHLGRCGMRGGPPFVGSPTFEVTLSGVPHSLLAVLFVGFSNQTFGGGMLPLPLGPTIGWTESVLSISPDLATGALVPIAPGEFSFPLFLPPAAGLSYTPLFFQWVALDATVQGFLAASQAGKTVAY